jgi:hypothetical protein
VDKRPHLEALDTGGGQQAIKRHFFLQPQDLLLELETVSKGFIFQDNAGHNASFG